MLFAEWCGILSSKKALRKRRAVGYILRKEVMLRANHVAYRALYGHDYREKQKPPLCQVTVSRLWLCLSITDSG